MIGQWKENMKLKVLERGKRKKRDEMEDIEKIEEKEKEPEQRGLDKLQVTRGFIDGQ